LAQALQVFESNKFKDSAANVAAFLALTEAEVGNFPAARRQATASVALSATRANLPTVAVALALAGDSSGARGLIDDLKRRYPSDFQVNGVFGPLVEALLQSATGIPQQPSKLCNQRVAMTWGPRGVSSLPTCVA